MHATRMLLTLALATGLAAAAAPAQAADAPATTAQQSPPAGRPAAPGQLPDAAGPTIYQLDNHNLKPSTLQKDGGRPAVADGKSFQNVCSFRTFRYTSDSGSYEDLGVQYDGSLSYVDYLPGYFNGNTYVSYAMQATDCNGRTGPTAYAATFLPQVVDSAAVRATGPLTTVYARNAYRGSYRQTSGLGRSVTLSGLDYDYNDALYAHTGPTGGTATVYVNGEKRGTANFYSPTPKDRVLVFAFGDTDPAYHSVRLVLTKAGAKGGTTMTLDAVGEFTG